MKGLALITIAITLMSLFHFSSGETIEATDKEVSGYEIRASDIMDKEEFDYEEQSSDATDEENFEYEKALDTMDEEYSASEYLLDILQAKTAGIKKPPRCTTFNGQVQGCKDFFIHISNSQGFVSPCRRLFL